MDCVAKYIPLALESEIIFVAELQREIGLFDACIKTLEKLENEKQFYEFRKIIIEKARNKDSVIFIWKTICDEESSIYIREIPE